jgi:endoglucanase
MRPRLLAVFFALAALVAAGSLGIVRPTNVAAATSTLAVSGNQLVDNGQTVILRGVNRSGSEYACWQNFGFFDGPSDDASAAAIAAWGTNAVRVPLNEDCWLGINGVPAAYSGANYQAAITGFVTRLRAHGLYVILSSQVAGPGTTMSTTILPMPDADHTPTFWSSVSTTFKTDKGVIFDLYNEPHDVSWSCWANGCPVTGGVNWVANYQAAGMKALTAAIRATGATNVILIAGLSWSYDISGWLANRPADTQLIAGIHNYGVSGWNTPAIWDTIYAPTALQVPVTFGEMGFDVYIETIMPWADAHGIGYLAWTWDTWGPPQALISNYNGTPTTYGLGFKNYLASHLVGSGRPGTNQSTANPPRGRAANPSRPSATPSPRRAVVQPGASGARDSAPVPAMLPRRLRGS